MRLYNICIRIEDTGLIDKTDVVTSDPEDAVLEVLLSYGNLMPSVLERLINWGKELRAVPSTWLFSAGLPGGCTLHATGSHRTAQQLALDEA